MTFNNVEHKKFVLELEVVGDEDDIREAEATIIAFICTVKKVMGRNILNIGYEVLEQQTKSHSNVQLPNLSKAIY